MRTWGLLHKSFTGFFLLLLYLPEFSDFARGFFPPTVISFIQWGPDVFFVFFVFFLGGGGGGGGCVLQPPSCSPVYEILIQRVLYVIDTKMRPEQPTIFYVLNYHVFCWCAYMKTRIKCPNRYPTTPQQK